MAWRIHDHVVRGEIDNREKGVVRGRLWLHDRTESVNLELQGNAWPDLAGCLLKFENPNPTVPMRPDAHFDPLQRGTIGDLTASRKVRVFDVPFDEAYAMIERGEKPPEHMANSLYLEWFSEANGRVVVESATYRLEISAPSWRLTSEEEQQRQQQAAEGFTGFLGKLSEAMEAARHEPPEEKEWNEFDYEKLMRESDARTDKYSELFEKYLDHPDRDQIIAREMGWADETEEDDAEAAVEEEDDSFDVDEINRITAEAEKNPPQLDPLTEGVDWVRDEDGDIKHPLSRRTLEAVLALMHKLDDLGVERSSDADLITLVSEFQITGAKLAGALDSLAYGRDLHDPAFTVAYLKRALAHLHQAQGGLENAARKKLLPTETVKHLRQELFEIRHEILRLMTEFRGQKGQDSLDEP